VQDKINIAINWYLTQQARKVKYSMTSRNGPDSYDCSSAGYYAFKAAGMLPFDIRVGNTDSMFGDFERNGWVQVKEDAKGFVDTKRGDAVIWGIRGASGGALGHFMLFTDANNVIHCNSYYSNLLGNSIHVDNYDNLARANGWPTATFYRYVGPANVPPAGDPNDQDVDKGSYIKFASALTVTDVQLIDGIWQVRSDDLCPAGFAWGANGVPAEPLYEVDDDGYQTEDQNLNPGSKFVLPGRYEVQDLGLTDGVWLALIEWNGLKFWVDIAKATEVAGTDGGTPVPDKRPATPSPQPAPAEQPAPVTPTVEQPAEEPAAQPEPQQPPTGEPEPAQEPTKEPTTNEPAKEPTKMAFTKEQQQELMINSQKLVDQGAQIAASDEGQKIIGRISEKTKMIVYFVGDTLLGLGALTPQVAIIVLSPDPVAKVGAISSALATAGLYVLTMFGIYKSGK
jgi:hypothetical protein